MPMIYTSPDPLLISHFRNILEVAGIDTFVRQQYLAGALGELPFTECWPQLWLRDERDLARASELITATAAVAGTDWQCECGERQEGQFTACWKCGRSRPG